MFAGLLLVVAAVSVRWLWLYRHGQPYDIDESGYLVFALKHHRGLFDAGLGGWWDSVLSPSVQAPLMTAATTPAFLVAGPNPIVGMVVPLAFGLVAAAATFLLGRRVGGPRAGWVAGLLALGAPLLLSYSRSYNFAIAATATLAVALLAFAKSGNLENRGWSAATGIFLGLTALARTMALAFLPAILLAMVVAVVAGPRRGRRAANAGIAVIVGLAVAFPWYRVNGSRVYDYLTSFGYGSRAQEYGTAEPFFSRAAWRTTGQYVVNSVYLPYLLVLLVAAAAGGAVVVWHIRRNGIGPTARDAARSPLMPAAILVAEGLVALTSSQNKGSGFVAPLIPAMAVGVAWAVGRVPDLPRRLLTGAAVAVVVVNLVAASDLDEALARPRRARVPVLGVVMVTDGRSTLQQYEAALDPAAGSRAQPLTRREGASWVAATADMAARIRAHDGQAVLTAFGFRHQLLNINSVQIEQLSTEETTLPLVQVAPVATTDTVGGYAGWLLKGDAAGACNLVTATGDAHEFPPAVTIAYMEQAATETGFVRDAQWSLPDERVVSLWRRPAKCPGGA
ncbi:MAG: hypothetical protein QOG82_1246 [Actinomycetota bacterium]|nr:hypothetical protein [Actinomycetota bacterium]